MNTLKIVGYTLTSFAILVGLTGCTPKDVSLLQKGTQLELTGKFAEAAAKYAESASLGNAEAYKKLGDMAIAHDFLKLTPENVSDFITGHDKWLLDAQQAVAKAKDYFEKAQLAGCTNMLQVSLDKLAACEKKIAETSSKISAAKEKEKQRLEEERKKREEEERIARAKLEEEERIAKAKREEEERIAKAEAERRAEEERKREEEETRRNSPEYCIENRLELPAAAFREVVREMTYYQDTGNELADDAANAEHHSRFRGQTIIVSGTIRKIESTFFTDKVKCIIDAYGKSISARFDSMSKSDGMRLSRGRRVTIEGRLSNRPVLSDIAMDGCEIR